MFPRSPAASERFDDPVTRCDHDPMKTAAVICLHQSRNCWLAMSLSSSRDSDPAGVERSGWRCRPISRCAKLRTWTLTILGNNELIGMRTIAISCRLTNVARPQSPASTEPTSEVRETPACLRSRAFSQRKLQTRHQLPISSSGSYGCHIPDDGAAAVDNRNCVIAS